MIVQSNYSYLDNVPLEAEIADTWERVRSGIVYPPEGQWLTATKGFRLPGGWGGSGPYEWKDDGYFVKAGQRFRLVQKGDPLSAAVWEVEDTPEQKKKAFVDAAHRYYLNNTARQHRELAENGYLMGGRYSWGDGLTGDEWESVDQAETCGEEAASQAIEIENEQE